MTTYTPSHFGICVTDLDASLRFWCDGLGFERVRDYPIGNDFADGLEVERDVQVTSQFIKNEAMLIELLDYQSPGTHGTPASSRNQVGLTHVAFVVDDVDAAAARLIDLGGTLIPSTRTNAPGGVELVFLADPDGVRVELGNSAVE